MLTKEQVRELIESWWCRIPEESFAGEDTYELVMIGGNADEVRQDLQDFCAACDTEFEGITVNPDGFDDCDLDCLIITIKTAEA